MKKNFKSVFVYILSIPFFLSSQTLTLADDKGSGISLKSIVDGTKNIVGNVGDKIGEGASKIYETEIPSSFFEFIFGVVGFILGIGISIFLAVLICSIPIKIFIFFYVNIKYIFKNPNKQSQYDIEFDLTRGKNFERFQGIYILLCVISYIILFLSFMDWI